MGNQNGKMHKSRKNSMNTQRALENQALGKETVDSPHRIHVLNKHGKRRINYLAYGDFSRAY